MATYPGEWVPMDSTDEPPAQDLRPQSPEWWLDRLSRALDARARRIKLYSAYYDGDHPLAFASAKFRGAFGGLFREFADNWCALVVDAVEERLNVEGFRLGDKVEGDKDAWKIWQANQLDADSQLAHTEALIHGCAYALVWEDGDGGSEITVEHPDQMIVAYAAGSRRRRAAALKKWMDDSGRVFATVYLPKALYKFESEQSFAGGDKPVSIRWRPRTGEEDPIPNPLDLVPVIPIENRPRLAKDGESEIHRIIPLQDAVNKLVADMLIASEFGSFRQRWATGIEIPVDPETNQPMEPFKAAVDRLWTSRSKDAKFGEFEQTDLSNFVKAIDMLTQHAASQSRTPPHYFYQAGNLPSGETIKSAETGLVAKAVRKQRFFGEAWEDVIRVAFQVMGKPRKASIVNTETIWGDPESRTESEHIDAVLKRKALGVPNRQLWEDAGYTPTQIQRFIEMGANPGIDAAPTVAPASSAPPTDDDAVE